VKQARVLIADDHQIVAEGLRSLLESDFNLVGIVTDGRALLEAAKTLQPDVIVVDISMPLINGIEATRHLRSAQIQAKIVVLTMHPDVTYAVRAFEAGASGYVLKHAASAELKMAIREALQGHVYISPLLAKAVVEASKARAVHRTGDPLTVRQREVLQLVAEGYSARKIALLLHISSRTVEFHKYRMMEILGLHNQADLIQYAIRQGIASV
jgi:DNA-binding NarL/FixJ family response regulator